MRKITTAVLISQFLGMMFAVPVVNAQTAGAGAGASGSGYANPAVVSSGPAVIVPPGMPMPVPPPMGGGFIQFNNLTVETVSGTNPPAEIVASNPNIYPMIGASGGGMGTSVPAAPSAAPSAKCYKFDTEHSTAGRAISCPTLKAMPSTATSTTQSEPNPSASGSARSPMIYPLPPYPIRYQPYRIEVDASTRLLLRDRTAATLGNFSPGDQINVFGYYNSDGSIQAYLIRDLSKPAQDEFIQLNNVDLVSISSVTIPATLIVAQTQGYPCYGFGAGGIKGPAKQFIACPMGAQAAANNPALQNISVPPALAPNWQLLRKYVINIDAHTIILDNNRTNLSLSDLQIGDQLNIYGDTIDNGQTLNADIVRDISIPAVPSTYNGKITQVNADGSFVIQTNDGKTITAQSPIQVGAAVQLTGVLDRLKNVLTQVSSMYFGADKSTPPVPVPMLRTQGGTPLPAGQGGMPNTRN